MQQFEILLSNVLSKEREKLIKTCENRLSLFQCQMTQTVKNLEAEVLSLRQEFLTSYSIQQDILTELKSINQRQTSDFASDNMAVQPQDNTFDIANQMLLKEFEDKSLIGIQPSLLSSNVAEMPLQREQMIVCKEETYDHEHPNFPATTNDLSAVSKSQANFDNESLAVMEIPGEEKSHENRFGEARSRLTSHVDNQSSDDVSGTERIGHAQSLFSIFSSNNAIEESTQELFADGQKSIAKKSNEFCLDEESVRKHVAASPSNEKHMCKVCDFSTTHKLELKYHMRIHAHEKPFKCPLCSKRFAQNNGLKCHIRVHTKGFPYSCNECGKKFSVASKLIAHTQMMHGTNNSFVCKVCRFVCQNSSSLKKHMLTHTGERNHKCHYCEKRFSHRGALQRHVRIHTGEKPFKCQECPAAFSDSSNFGRHVIMIHTKQYPHRCNICNKGFLSPGALAKHEQESHSSDTMKNTEFYDNNE